MSFYYYGNSSIEQSLNYLENDYLKNYQDQSHLYTNVKLTPEPISNKYKTITSTTSESNNISINFYLGLGD
jgi:Zn-dependent M16 (insulinase) family peptidase